jgi:hypothetical protein
MCNRDWTVKVFVAVVAVLTCTGSALAQGGHVLPACATPHGYSLSRMARETAVYRTGISTGNPLASRSRASPTRRAAEGPGLGPPFPAGRPQGACIFHCGSRTPGARASLWFTAAGNPSLRPSLNAKGSPA